VERLSTKNPGQLTDRPALSVSPAGKLMFQVTGAFAEFERSMIRQRVNAGLKRAVDASKQLGRPPRGRPFPERSQGYIFTVYAVDEDKLQFAKDHNVSAAVVGFELHFHAKAKGILTAIYGR
jgi:DNA invertase Pin-like site-specific DNA recombinase